MPSLSSISRFKSRIVSLALTSSWSVRPVSVFTQMGYTLELGPAHFATSRSSSVGSALRFGGLAISASPLIRPQMAQKVILGEHTLQK
jgi:hypothetical protein